MRSFSYRALSSCAKFNAAHSPDTLIDFKNAKRNLHFEGTVAIISRDNNRIGDYVLAWEEQITDFKYLANFI
jgi:hypothetical protein